MGKFHGPPSRVDMYQRNMDRRGTGMYFVSESQQLRSFFATVGKHIAPKSCLLECGYGPGALGVYLSRIGYEVVSIDMDPDVVELARRTNALLGGKVDYQVCDLFEIDKIFAHDTFNAAISDVTLEHFDDDDAVEALTKQLVVAKLNIFAVHCANILPRFFPGLDGGERLHRPAYWEELIKRAGGRVIDRFGYGFDYTRIGQMNWRIPTIAERIFYHRLAGLAAATGFVVVRNEA